MGIQFYPLAVYFFIFLFGLVFGSFLNSLFYRLERGESFFKGRSFCPKCGQILSWPDLIPILSFLFLRGKCRSCGQKISLQYPLVELATAILFLLVYIHGPGQIPLLFFHWLFTSFLIIIFLYDLRHYLVPEKIIYPAIFLALSYQLFNLFFFDQALAKFLNLGLALLPALFFLFLILLSGGKWLGFGDFQLAIFLGLFLTWPKVFLAFFLSFLFGAIIGVGLIFFKKKSLKSQIPFAPFLVTGTFISLFWGEQIIDFYFALIR